MYNIDFLQQLERAREHLFGEGVGEVREHLDDIEASGLGYFPPPDVKILKCHEDTNGEWVPDQSSLDTAVV